MTQLHKKFTDDQVKTLIERYLEKEIESHYVQEILNIGKTRFFALVKRCRKNPDNFSVQYTRRTKINGIAEVRFWCNDELIDVQRVKNNELNIVHF